MQLLASLSQFEAIAVGIVLGLLFALSVLRQLRLQRNATKTERGKNAGSTFERVSLAGLSLALLFFGIVAARQVTAIDRYDFMGVFFGVALVAWLIAYFARGRDDLD